MSRRISSSLRTTLGVALLACLLVLLASGTAIADADNDVSGALDLTHSISAGSGTCTGTVDAATDADDVYWVYMEAGSSLVVTLTAPGTADVDLYLFDKGTLTVADRSKADLKDDGSTYPKRVPFTVDSDGIYYLDVHAAGGSGSYQMGWQRYIAPNDNIPGVLTTATPISGELWTGGDWLDVYKIYARAGDVIDADIQALPAHSSADVDFDLWLFSPSATDSYDDSVLESTDSTSSTEWIYRRVSTSGYYYLAVYCDRGHGIYDLSWDTYPASSPSMTKSPTGSYYSLYRHSGVAKWTYKATLKYSDGIALDGKKVFLQRSTNGTTWKTYYTLYTNSYGKISKTLSFKTAGTTYWRWYSPADTVFNSKTLSKTKIRVH